MYDYFRGLWENREKAVFVGLIVAFLLLAVCWFSYCLGLRNAGTDVSDNGKRIEDVRNELSTATERQREITSGLESALETNLAQLRSANERLQVDLRAQSSEATQLKKELAALRKELSDLKALSVTQESSLTNANKLLEEYAIEAKRERLRIKAQRNGWAAAAACLAVALVVKS